MSISAIIFVDIYGNTLLSPFASLFCFHVFCATFAATKQNSMYSIHTIKKSDKKKHTQRVGHHCFV